MVSRSTLENSIRQLTVSLVVMVSWSLSGCGAAPPKPGLSEEARARLDARSEQASGDLDRALKGPVKAPEIKTKRKRVKRKKAQPAKRRAVQDESGGLMTELPSPPGDSLWADGADLTLAEAVQKARHNVSSQISAKVSGQVDIEMEEGDKRVSEQARVQVRSTTRFEHAALARTIGYTKGPDGFVARVALSRAEAIDAYERDMRAGYEALERIQPALKRAIQAEDAAILLKTEWSPEAVLSKQRERAQILTVLGKPTSVDTKAALTRLSKQAALARSQAVIRLSVDGQGSPALRRAVVGEVGRLFTARGCRFVLKGSTAESGPQVDAKLRLATSESTEAGVLFKAVGFELNMTDSKSGSPVFHYSGLPEVAHGGGTTAALAEQGLISRLREKLAEKVAPAFRALSCK